MSSGPWGPHPGTSQTGSCGSSIPEARPPCAVAWQVLKCHDLYTRPPASSCSPRPLQNPDSPSAEVACSIGQRPAACNHMHQRCSSRIHSQQVQHLLVQHAKLPPAFLPHANGDCTATPSHHTVCVRSCSAFCEHESLRSWVMEILCSNHSNSPQVLA